MVIEYSNKLVDVNALCLAKKLQENSKSIKKIYQLLPNASKTMFSQPNIVSREHNHYLGDDVGGVTLRSTPDNQPDPLSETERACLARYLDQQLMGLHFGSRQCQIVLAIDSIIIRIREFSTIYLL